MKKLIGIYALCLWFVALCAWAGPEIFMTPKKAAGGVTYQFHETFQGTASCGAGNAYCDNVWAQTYSGDNSWVVSTSAPIESTRSLLIQGEERKTYFTGLTGTVYLAMRIVTPSVFTGASALTFLSSTASHTDYCGIDIDGAGLLGVLYGGSSTNYGAFALSLSTAYYLQLVFVPGTGSSSVTAYSCTTGCDVVGNWTSRYSETGLTLTDQPTGLNTWNTDLYKIDDIRISNVAFITY